MRVVLMLFEDVFVTEIFKVNKEENSVIYILCQCKQHSN